MSDVFTAYDHASTARHLLEDGTQKLKAGELTLEQVDRVVSLATAYALTAIGLQLTLADADL